MTQGTEYADRNDTDDETNDKTNGSTSDAANNETNDPADTEASDGIGTETRDYNHAGERWIVEEGDNTTFDIDDIRELCVAVVKGRIDVIGHDDPGCRLEVSNVIGLPVEVTVNNGKLVVRDFDDNQSIHMNMSTSNLFAAFRAARSLLKHGDLSAGKSDDDRNRASADISLLVPRDIAATISSVKGDVLISGMANGATLDTVSGTLLSDNVSGKLKLNSVSGRVEARNHHGSVVADTVSGDVIVSGDCTAIKVDAVSGKLYADVFGTPQTIRYHSMNGSAVIRLDPDVCIHCRADAMNGKVEIGGTVRKLRGRFDYQDGLADGLAGGPADGLATTIRFDAMNGKLKIVRRAVSDAADAEQTASGDRVADDAVNYDSNEKA